MAVLESCPKHNMVAYLEKTEGNAEFHEVIDFLARSSIHHALTVSPVVSTTFVEQFWMSAKSKIINNVRYITAKVAGKPVSISEASIRSDPSNLILGDPQSAVQTRSKVSKSFGANAFKISEAFEDKSWVDALHEELLQFKIQKVWILVDMPYGKKVKRDQEGIRCHVTILNTIENLGKFDKKSDEGFLVGYSLQSKAFRVYNLETMRVEENLHITFLENKPNITGKGPTWLFNLDYLTDLMNYQPARLENQANKHASPQEANHNAGTKDNIDVGDSEKEDEFAQDYFVLPIWSSYSTTVKRSTEKDVDEAPNKHPDLKIDEKPVYKENQVFLDEHERLKRQEKDAINAAETLRKEFAQETKDLLLQLFDLDYLTDSINYRPVRSENQANKHVVADFTNLEPIVNISPIPTSRITSIHPSTLILRDPQSAVYRNKKDERGVVVRNKARLVSQGHRQEEGIDYGEVFAPVARIEAIWIFLAFASYMGFIVYQMDVKSAFLYGKIDEEVYVSQPPGFIDPKYPQKNGYRKGTIDKTLFIKKDKHDIILVQVYVDDIIFGSTKKSWCDEFEALMKSRFQMSSMGELTFFLGLQVKQKEDGIFISQDKYVAEILKKFDFVSVKTASTPIETQKPLVKDEEASDVDVHLYRSMIGSLMYLTASRPDIMFAVCACSRFQVTPKTSHLSAVKRIFRYLKGKPKLGLWYPRVSSFDLEAYSDSDYAGANLDRKSTTGGCQFLGRRLISWQCKKQTIVATSTTEAEYVAAASCCGQVLWIQNQMLDYGFNFMNTKIYIDNESTICIVKNPVYHSKTKHIAIRHHFIRDAYEKKLIQVLKIHTDDNVADLLTKAFDVSSSLGFRESLGRALDGTEALMLPKLFILWLATVSTDSAELVPMGKVSTAIETLKKNTAKALISLSPTITHSKIMVVLESCPKHNMVAYLEKTDGNAEFHEIIDFLTRSSIHHALTVSPVVSTTFVEQFWTSAKSKIINNVRHITAKVAGKPVSISEASIRSDLLFDDADGIDSLPNQAIFDAIQLMGYEGDLTVLTFNKALFSPQWRFLFHTMNHCISSKSTSWDQIPTNIATAVICLTSNQKYNFSKLIFDGMLRHLDAKKKFVMYPRFISIFLDKQLENVPVPLDHFPVNALTSKVFSFMVKKGKHFSGKVTPLFASMLVQPIENEGEQSERPSEPQLTPSPPHPSKVHVETQSDPSPRPSLTTHIPDSILESSGGNHGDQAKEIKHLKAQIKKLKKKAKPVITHHRAWMKSVSMKQRLAGKKSLKTQWMQKESVSKQGRKPAKAEPSVHKDPLFDELADDTLDYMDTENAQDVGRTRNVVYEEKESAEDAVSTEDVVSADKEKVSTDRSKDSTDKEKDSTDKEKDSTDRPDEGTEGRSATPTTPTPTPTTFGDDETIAQVLLNMSQAKAVSREKEKGVELKDVEKTERPRPTSTRSLLTLKPLPKIDPKDKGKKKIEEEDESDTESEGIPEAEKKFKQLARDEEMARKVQEDWEAEEEVKKLAEEEAIKAALSNEYDFIQARIEADRLLALRLQDEEREQFTKGLKKKVAKETPKKEDTVQVPAKVDVTEQGTKKRKGGHMKMLARKRKRPQSDVDSDDEHRKCLKIVIFEGTIDSAIMERKSVIARLNKVSSPDEDYLVIYRANGNFRAFNYLLKVLHIFDIQDLFHLYELVMKQYLEVTMEGIELILWGDLKIMMESSKEENDQSDFWNINKIGD
ncbi:putative ribonuclease H-like domain-containing protein [Tanacetum coccineum]|uniref:Ribonuclease H-like domain-containing protein n=1 Tax=Tanacetum coccineum TaxID=301880 RepID=A0ABQ4X1R4_9ASTR